VLLVGKGLVSRILEDKGDDILSSADSESVLGEEDILVVSSATNNFECRLLM
jgi:hypothetical protein